jgi:predicted membrane protein
MKYIAHTGEEAVAQNGLIEALGHQPVWVSLLVVAFVLFGVYALLEKLRVKPANRVIALLPLLILLAILFMQHSPAVSTVLLSVGFVAAFFFAFTAMTGQKKEQSKQTDKPEKTDEIPQ